MEASLFDTRLDLDFTVTRRYNCLQTPKSYFLLNSILIISLHKIKAKDCRNNKFTMFNNTNLHCHVLILRFFCKIKLCSRKLTMTTKNKFCQVSWKMTKLKKTFKMTVISNCFSIFQVSLSSSCIPYSSLMHWSPRQYCVFWLTRLEVDKLIPSCSAHDTFTCTCIIHIY